jgi:hypothetical protein
MEVVFQGYSINTWNTCDLSAEISAQHADSRLGLVAAGRFRVRSKVYQGRARRGTPAVVPVEKLAELVALTG